MVHPTSTVCVLGPQFWQGWSGPRVVDLSTSLGSLLSSETSGWKLCHYNTVYSLVTICSANKSSGLLDDDHLRRQVREQVQLVSFGRSCASVVSGLGPWKEVTEVPERIQCVFMDLDADGLKREVEREREVVYYADQLSLLLKLFGGVFGLQKPIFVGESLSLIEKYFLQVAMLFCQDIRS